MLLLSFHIGTGTLALSFSIAPLLGLSSYKSAFRASMVSVFMSGVGLLFITESMLTTCAHFIVVTAGCLALRRFALAHAKVS